MRLLKVTIASLILLFGFSRVKSSNLMVNNTIQKNDETGLLGKADAESEIDIDNARETGEIDTKKEINGSIPNNQDIHSELLEDILSRKPEWRNDISTSQNSSVSVQKLIYRIITEVLSMDGREWKDSNNTDSNPSDNGLYLIKKGASEDSKLTIL